ncbi:YgdI/YgdR family lipoprotein [Salmonella enterica]|nr:YgdI/YgdR family lipoprotein [Salmonella enterica]
MKKLFICSGLGMMFFMLAGCTTNYVMTTKNGQTIVTQGKPQLDKETGMMMRRAINAARPRDK